MIAKDPQLCVICWGEINIELPYIEEETQLFLPDSEDNESVTVFYHYDCFKKLTLNEKKVKVLEH